jgi:hypothetical protein
MSRYWLINTVIMAALRGAWHSVHLPEAVHCVEAPTPRGGGLGVSSKAWPWVNQSPCLLPAFLCIIV